MTLKPEQVEEYLNFVYEDRAKAFRHMVDLENEIDSLKHRQIGTQDELAAEKVKVDFHKEKWHTLIDNNDKAIKKVVKERNSLRKQLKIMTTAYDKGKKGHASK